MTVIRGLNGVASARTLASFGDFAETSTLGLAPTLLGASRVVLLAPGPDGLLTVGRDGGLQVVRHQDSDSQLRVLKVKVTDPRKPFKPVKVIMKGQLLVEQVHLGRHDLTVSIGSAAQTIPGDLLAMNSKGDITYRDRKGVNGFITSFKLKAKSGKISLKGKGVDTGLESICPDYIPVAFESSVVFVSTGVIGEAKKRVVVFRL